MIISKKKFKIELIKAHTSGLRYGVILQKLVNLTRALCIYESAKESRTTEDLDLLLEKSLKQAKENYGILLDIKKRYSLEPEMPDKKYGEFIRVHKKLSEHVAYSKLEKQAETSA